jgi:hypothetical protein
MKAEAFSGGNAAMANLINNLPIKKLGAKNAQMGIPLLLMANRI